MAAKKIILTIIISGFIVLTCTAQEMNKFEKFQDRLKKGNSTLGININLFQLIETGDHFYFGCSPSIEYSYFMINRFSINASLKYKQQFFSFYRTNDRSIESNKSIDFCFRYYFFKRGGFFIDLGGSFGHIFVKNIDELYVDELDRKFYAAPKIEIGYSYMITNVWKKIDNKVSFNFLINSYIPYKKRSNFDICDDHLPYFPFFSAEVGVVYYFIRK